MKVSKKTRDLAKQVHGRTLKWDVLDGNPSLYFDAIVLCNPDISDKVSIKPYGYKPITLARKLNDVSLDSYSNLLKEVSKESFCFLTIAFDAPDINNCLENLLKCAANRKGRFLDLHDPIPASTGYPTCNY